jgi:prepilin-type N-terminal cleavage/methylation domain-containing protein
VLLIARSRLGLTLIELLVSLVILGIVGTVTYKFLANTQRVTRGQSELVILQSNIRTGVLVVPTELREIGVGPTGSDIVSMSGTGIEYRAARGLGFTCQVAASEIRITNTTSSPYFGLRSIVPGRDSLFVFVEGNPGLSSDDSWARLAVTGVDPASVCGSDPAIAIGVANLAAVVPGGLGAIDVGGPVRPFEVMELRLYPSGGKFWLGARSVSGGELSLQPVLGPLTSNGLELAYFNAAGNPTANRNQVRSIRVAIRGVTDQLIRGPAGTGPTGYIQDSLITTVSLRNAPIP